MQTKNSTIKTKLSRFLKAPIRVLIKMRDFYIQNMSECAGGFGHGSAMGCPTAQVSILPKSFSVNSSLSSNNEEISDLIKAASTKSSLGGKIELDLRRRQLPVTGVNVVTRCQSVGIGRIDEDRPCEFGEDVKVKTVVYPRSKSYAVSKRTGVF
ncbi:uncharacterized protein LOC132316556 [Cornus florida]|uniref:uncharacterized protein LOC132316556 n=1 Tax=Cornus florida TaxID=4283 RepID=UPI002897BE6C|nr:uncharacterized protein LOC132316556 [Cornus florida]